MKSLGSIGIAIKRLLIIFLLAGVTSGPIRAAEVSLDMMQGKWSITKTNREGKQVSQTMDINKDQLTFRMLDADQQLRFVAKGTVKVEKFGPFYALMILNIEGGRTESDLNPVDDHRNSIITLRDGNLVMASNFDRQRDNENPGIEIYRRVSADSNTVGTSDNAILGTWNVDLTFGENTLEYTLKISKKEGKLAATMVSPRSGEYPAKNITFKNGELAFELERVIDGNDVTFVYNGKLRDNKISGPFSVKQNDEFKGTWNAKK